MSTYTLIELAELVLQNNYFELNEQYLKHQYKVIQCTAIGTKFALPYAVIYKAGMLTTFMIWKRIEDELKIF